MYWHVFSSAWTNYKHNPQELTRHTHTHMRFGTDNYIDFILSTCVRLNNNIWIMVIFRTATHRRIIYRISPNCTILLTNAENSENWGVIKNKKRSQNASETKHTHIIPIRICPKTVMLSVTMMINCLIISLFIYVYLFVLEYTLVSAMDYWTFHWYHNTIVLSGWTACLHTSFVNYRSLISRGNSFGITKVHFFLNGNLYCSDSIRLVAEITSLVACVERILTVEIWWRRWYGNLVIGTLKHILTTFTGQAVRHIETLRSFVRCRMCVSVFMHARFRLCWWLRVYRDGDVNFLSFHFFFVLYFSGFLKITTNDAQGDMLRRTRETSE